MSLDKKFVEFHKQVRSLLTGKWEGESVLGKRPVGPFQYRQNDASMTTQSFLLNLLLFLLLRPEFTQYF